MKKIICIILTAVILIFSAVPVFADAEPTDTATADISQNSSAFSCVFDVENNNVKIHGTINHDILVKYGDFTICIYKIPLGSTYENAINDESNRVVSNAPITIKFEYKVKANTVMDRFSQYALILSSPDGNMYLASAPKIPNISIDYQDIDDSKTGFKGIETSNVAAASNLSPATAIINIDVNALYGNASNCYLYPMGDTFAYIDKTLVSDIDAQVLSLSRSGSDIYLRFLVRADDNILSLSEADDDQASKLSIPDIYDQRTLDYICALSSFLAKRYDNTDKGYINGVVLGRKMDDVSNTNEIGDLTFDEYVQRYVIYMVSVANSMRNINPNIDIVVPISDANDYSVESDALAADFIEKITTTIEEIYTDDTIFSVMLELSGAPFGISNDTLNNKIDTSTINENAQTISVENIEIFDEFFKNLPDRFDAAPKHYSVLWETSAGVSGNALSCAYAYSYYKLFSMNNVSSFILSVLNDDKDLETQRFNEISNIFRYINTKDTFRVTSNLLEYFGVNNWSEILPVNSSDRYAVNEYFSLSVFNEVPKNALGSFNYFDFSSSVSISNWKNGINIKTLKNEYSSLGGKALHITSSHLTCGEYLEFYHVYDNAESFKYTPCIALDITFDTLKNQYAIFEVNVMFGNDNSIAYASKAFTSGKNGTIILDMEEFNDQNSVEYLKISIRPITDIDEPVSLWLNSLTGYSYDYDNTELDELIKLERLKAQSDNDAEQSSSATYKTLWTALAIGVTIISIGIGLFVVFKKDE